MSGKFKVFFRQLLLWQIFLLCLSKISSSQTCQSSQFGQSFGFDGSGSGAYSDTVIGGGFIVGNVRNYKKALIRADEQGGFLWAKQYDFSGNNVYTDYSAGKADKNGNYVIDVNGVAVALLNSGGDVIKMNELKISYSTVVIRDIFILPDNKKLIFLKDQGFYGGEAYGLVCLSEDISTILWSKYFSGTSLYVSNPDYIDNKLFFSGRLNDGGLFFCVNAITGAILEQRRFNIGAGWTIMRNFYKTDSGYIATAQHNSDPSYPYVVMRLDNNFKPRKAYGISNISANQSLLLIAEPDGSYFGCSGNGGTRFAVSATDQLKYSNYSTLGFQLGPTRFFKYRGGLVSVATGNWQNVGSNYGSAISILKSDENGLFPCPGNVLSRSISAVNVRESALSIYYRDSSFFNLTPVTPIVTTLVYRLGSSCTSAVICNSLKIEGTQNICGSGVYTYTGKRNSGCTLPVRWELLGLNGGSTTQEKLSDSTITLGFSQPGKYYLIGSLGADCVADTIKITVSGNAQQLDLGLPETSLCQGSSIILDAGAGFSSYIWQNGSNLQTFVVSVPGKYYVTAVSNCGVTFSDTIRINLAPPVTISLGSDRIKCNLDTLHLSAPSGFLNYWWGNNYHINTLTGQSVIVHPDVDTFYFVKAEKTPGCFAYDTVQIHVYTSPLINLGSDTSICAGSILHLDAGYGFEKYTWNNDLFTKQITVSNPGLYFVIGTTKEGCNSYDTLNLISVHNLPNPLLDKREGICKGEIRTLNAGQFQNYLWHDGSTRSTFEAYTTGVYYVKVTDINGCQATDTSVINNIYDPPANFLPPTIEICNYSNATIQAVKNYQSYQWSNGSNLKTITASNPGLYWLRVTDQYGCKGEDSVTLIKKQCLSGLFVPTAFSPNGDGKNDELKAILLGSIHYYKFDVYNRYGQLVFTTTDALKGWNGLYKEMPQQTGNFVWVCRYRINNEPERVEKGNSVLIR